MFNTKSLHVPMVPMSTLMLMLFVVIIGFVLLGLLLNPLMMLLFHTFNPRFAASLAHNTFFCGERVKAFYTKLALQWPYKWSKWWITPDRLEILNDFQQKDYYLTVSTDDEILWNLRPKVWAKVMTDKSVKIPFSDELAEKIKARDDLFKALIDEVFETQQSYKLVQQYLEYGTLPKLQMTALVDYVCLEGIDHAFGKLADELCAYVKRCGIRKDLFNKIRNDEALSDDTKDVIEESYICYTQRTMTKRIRKANEKKETYDGYKTWYAFCKSVSDIRVAAQKEMNIEQYKIFHQYGHKLGVDAITYLLWFGNEEMAEWIFCYEPKFGIQDAKINLVMDRHAYLRPLLKDVIARTEKFLCHNILEGERLSLEQVNQMFDCPSAAEMVGDYITKHELPDELQMRIFELPNAKEIIDFYVELSQTGNDYKLTPEAKAKAVELGWIEEENKVSDN